MPPATVQIPRAPIMLPTGQARQIAGTRYVRLGRLPRAVGARPVLRLQHYLDRSGLSVPPAAVDLRPLAKNPLARMYANDRWGCCDISSVYHQIGVWTGNDTTQGPAVAVEATDAEVIRQYHEWSGPGDPGSIMTVTLDKWMVNGASVGGLRRKIRGYLAIDPTDRVQLQVAVALFGGVRIGLEYLAAWQNQSVQDGTWDDVSSPSLGGHSIPGVGYDTRGLIVSTWGLTLWLTWAALANPRITEECYVVVSEDWTGADQRAVPGVGLADLLSDLEKWKQGTTPDYPPAVPPAPPVPPVPPVTPGKPVSVVITGEMTMSEAARPTFVAPQPVAAPVHSAGVQLLTAIAGKGATIDLTALGIAPSECPRVSQMMVDLLAPDHYRVTLRRNDHTVKVEKPDGMTSIDWAAWLALLVQVIQAIAQLLGKSG